MFEGDVVKFGRKTAALLRTVLVGAALAFPARAADVTPPVITHVPPGSCPAQVVGAAPTPCSIEAVIIDESGVFDPTLLVRLQGVQSFDRVPMKPIEGRADTFSATVPAALVAAGTIEYFVEAFDVQGNGPARAGGETTPLQLKIPAVVDVTPPVEDDNTGLIVGVGVAVGVAIVVGVGVGVAVYALRPPALTEVTVSVTAPSPIGAALRGVP